MINTVPRVSYFVRTNDLKSNNLPLNPADYMTVGYMAGRYGINLGNNPNENNPMQITKDGAFVNINSCTAPLFEKNLNDVGIKFDRLA